MRAHWLMVWTSAAFGALSSPGLLAKGLDEISEKNPEATDSTAKDGGEAGTTDGAQASAPLEKSALSLSISEKLFLGTSFGWVKASKGEGDWESGGGLSDVVVGYQLRSLGPTMGLAGTYRYAPIAVSGKQDGHSYRGVWDIHYVGARLDYLIHGIKAFGAAELGYVLVYLRPTDGIEERTGHEDNGVTLALGGGADLNLIEKSFALGPRVHVGFGGVTTVQVSAAATLVF